MKILSNGYREKIKLEFEVERMEPLFKNQEEYDTFRIVMPLTRLKHAL